MHLIWRPALMLAESSIIRIEEYPVNGLLRYTPLVHMYRIASHTADSLASSGSRVLFVPPLDRGLHRACRAEVETEVVISFTSHLGSHHNIADIIHLRGCIWESHRLGRIRSQ